MGHWNRAIFNMVDERENPWLAESCFWVVAVDGHHMSNPPQPVTPSVGAV